MSPHKVLWKEQSAFLTAAAISPRRLENVPIADHKLMLVDLETEQEANYLSGVLNSGPVRCAVKAFVVETQTSTHLLESIAVPKFVGGNGNCRNLSDLSKQCHSAVAKDDSKALSSLRREIDKAAAKLWGITDDELGAIQEALAESGKSKRAEKESTDSADDAE